MTGALDGRMRSLAQQLAGKYGKQVTLIRTLDSYDPKTGDVTQAQAETITNATPPKDYTISRIDGTLIQQGDTVIQVPAKDLKLGTPAHPTKSDKVNLDGVVWGIVQVGSVYSGEQVAQYTLHLRK